MRLLLQLGDRHYHQLLLDKVMHILGFVVDDFGGTPCLASSERVESSPILQPFQNAE